MWAGQSPARAITRGATSRPLMAVFCLRTSTNMDRRVRGQRLRRSTRRRRSLMRAIQFIGAAYIGPDLSASSISVAAITRL